MTAKEILRASHYSEVFSGVNLDAEYKTLAKVCHPDAGGSVEAFQKLKDFRDQYVQALDSGIVLRGNNLCIGKNPPMEFLGKASFELGDVYVGESSIAYVLDAEKDKITAKIKPFQFTSTHMRDTMSPILPQGERITPVKGTPTKVVRQYSKTDDQFLTDHILRAYGALDDKHVAWCISRLLDLGCYFKLIQKQVPLDISRYNTLISPKYHSVSFTGALWYAADEHGSFSVLPKRIVQDFARSTLDSKKATFVDYLDQVKLFGKELMGDRTGKSLLANGRNSVIVRWLNFPGTDDIVQEFSYWKSDILVEAFGPPKFVNWTVASDDLYRRI